ncbi:hypothetical protein ACIBIZ_19805 [Nonomuraea spiralis]|uniref:hypothetical protein n=1 Tax=Nonomuraea TaxID=83681 RepID=UPI000F797D83|nr:hypothetical protein [Nonomuraea sp. WAC 01424]RSM95287.1 hypothetical protein DMB42_50130 [Nonomuraea sp. WAC 01424]
MTWTNGHIAWVARTAHRSWIRYNIAAAVSGLSAIGTTFTVAVQAPPWLTATLGLVAAVGQFFQQFGHDREKAHLGHQQAVKLQKALRDYVTDSAELSGTQLRRRFAEFRRQFESLKEEYGSEILKVRALDMPQIAQQNGSDPSRNA